MAFDSSDVSATPKPIGTFKLIEGSDGQLMDCSGKASVRWIYQTAADIYIYISIYKLNF